MGCISEQEEYIVLTTALKHLEVFLLSTREKIASVSFTSLLLHK